MIRRCVTKSTGNYKWYGARGITVCERWRLFENFMADMGPTHQPGLQLDRIDNEKGYSPDNCRWATRGEQARNRRTNRFVEAFGKRQTVIEWSRELGVQNTTIFYRLDNGWKPEDAVSQKPNRKTYRAPTSPEVPYVVPAPRPA